MKAEYEKIKQSKIYLIPELDHVKAEHKDEISRLVETREKKTTKKKKKKKKKKERKII